MESALNNAPCGYVTFDDRGFIREVNETLCKLLGYQQQSLRSGKLESLFDIAGRIFFQTHFFPMLKMQSNVEEIFLNLVSFTNEKIPVVANASRSEVGDEIINTCVFIPVHNRRKFEDELIAAKQQAEKSLRENHALIEATKQADIHARELERRNQSMHLLNNEIIQISNILNHEVKECIRKIVIFSKLSKEDNAEDYLEKIINTANRLKQINNSVNEILNLTATSRGFIKCSIKEIISRAQEKLPVGGLITLNYKGQPPPDVEVLPEQMEMLFYQLLHNSIKYRTSNKVLITIDSAVFEKNIFTFNENKYHYQEVLQLTISDNSEGFDNQYNNYVFSILKTLGKAKDGIGTGLALCKKVIDNHHGEISITSTPGNGTSVKIILPLTQEYSVDQ